ncbi:LAFA_0D06150g1_1 [Lachancea sp. 'fantastica']|nr:LAFA_0D06150g1_1 [Lachancea sp. 'fantastica']
MSIPARSFPDKKRKVARRACLACRAKKIKCDGECSNPASNIGSSVKEIEVCTNCAIAGIKCVFVESQRGGRRLPRKALVTSELQNPPSNAELLPPVSSYQPPPLSGYDPRLIISHQPTHLSTLQLHPQFRLPSRFLPDPMNMASQASMLPSHAHLSFPSPSTQVLSPLPSFRANLDVPQSDQRLDSNDSSNLGRLPAKQQLTHHLSKDVGVEVQSTHLEPRGITSKNDFCTTRSSANTNTSPQKVPNVNFDNGKLSLESILAPTASPQRQTSPQIVEMTRTNPPCGNQDALSAPRYTNESLKKYGFPSWNECTQMIELFYEVVHPQLPILPPKNQFLCNFHPSNNTSLSHALFSCVSPYVHEDVSARKSGHHEKITYYWHDLDLLASLQTLLLLAFFNIKFTNNRNIAEEHITKAVKIAYYSYSGNGFANGNLEKLLKVAPIKVGRNNEMLMTTTWRLYLLAQLGRLYFDDMKFCSNMTWSDAEDPALSKLLRLDSLPFPPYDFTENKNCTQANAFPFKPTDLKTDENPWVYLNAAIDMGEQLSSNTNIDASSTGVSKLETGVNSMLVRYNGDKIFVNSTALEAKLVLLTLHVKRITANWPVISLWCVKDLDTVAIWGDYFTESQKLLDENILNSSEFTFSDLLDIFVVIQDCVVLLKLGKHASMTEPIGPCSKSAGVMFQHDYASDQCLYSSYPQTRASSEQLPGQQNSVNCERQIWESSSRPSVASIKAKSIWRQYPPLLRKIVRQSIPFQVLLLSFSKSSSVSIHSRRPSVSYSKKKLPLFPDCFSETGSFRNKNIDSFGFGVKAGEFYGKENVRSLLCCLCDFSQMKTGLILSLEYLQYDAALLEENSTTYSKIESMISWAKTLVSTP